MAAVERIPQFDLTVPAGTPVVNPAKFSTVVDPGFNLEWVEFEVPPGARGQVGFYLASSGVQVFPHRVGVTPRWVRMDGVMPRYDVDYKITSGDWSIVAYNTGLNPHLIVVRFGLTLVPDPASSVMASRLIPSSVLAGALSRT